MYYSVPVVLLEALKAYAGEVAIASTTIINSKLASVPCSGAFLLAPFRPATNLALRLYIWDWLDCVVVD